ncbi:MAG: BatA domain-containing protein [Phycisphaerales bacterium]
MTFLNAAILTAGLLSIAIPIAIHLLMRRRRRPVPWAAMRFVQEAFKRTRRRLLVQRWLLLAARCLLLAMLALALGRPLLGVGQNAGPGGRSVVLVIDNSIASGLTIDGRTALERHIAAARTILTDLNPGAGDRAGLVLLAGPSEAVVMPPTTGISGLLELLDTLAPTDSAADWPGAIAQVSRGISGAARVESGSDASASSEAIDPTRTLVVLLSDFAQGSAELTQPLARLPAGVRVAAAGRDLAATGAGTPNAVGTSNVGISRLAPLRQVSLVGDTALAQTASVELIRSGTQIDRPLSVPVRLSWSDAQRTGGADAGPSTGTSAGSASVVEARFEPGQRSTILTVSLPSPPGGASSTALLSASIDADALVADNTQRSPIEARTALRIGLISEQPAAGAASGVGVMARDPDSIPAGQWAALALRPTLAGSAGLELSDIDPAGVDSARLAGLDAALVFSPQRLDDEAWQRLNTFASTGGLVIIWPSADAGVQAWPDSMVRVLNAPMTIEREVRDIAPADGGTGAPARLVAPAPGLVNTRADARSDSNGDAGITRGNTAAGVPSATAAPNTPDTSPNTQPDAQATARQPSIPAADASPIDLLATVRAELEDLLQPVRVMRTLAPVQVNRGATVLLRLEPGPPLVVAWRPTGTQAGAAGRGVFVYMGVSLNTAWTDLPAKPLMVPLLQELVRQGISRARPALTLTAGVPFVMPAEATELRPIGGANDTLNSDAPGAAAQPITLDAAQRDRPLTIRRAGLYAAFDAAAGDRGLVAINPDARGADISPQNRAAVGQWLSGLLPASAAGAANPAAPGDDDLTRAERDRGATQVLWLDLDQTASGDTPTAAQSSASVRTTSLSGLWGAGIAAGIPTGPILLAGVLLLALIELALARWASITPGGSMIGGSGGALGASGTGGTRAN